MNSSIPPLSVADSHFMDVSAVSKAANKTVITNLDDGCLLEVFKHLTLADLCTTADVCHSFRANARTHFASLKLEEAGLRIECLNGYGRILKTARSECLRKTHVPGDLPIHTVLRNFGNLIHSIKIISDSTISGIKFAKSVLDGASLYCSGTLIDLDLVECAIDAQIELALRPLLSNLQTLSLDDSKCGELIGGMFSLCSSLRKLQFLHLRYRPESSCEAMRFDDVLRQPFPELELISFRNVSSVKNNDFEEFLKLNPQLKKIEVLNCENIDGTIFLSIARHTSHIETIHIDAVTRRIKDKNLQYFSKLSSLSTLKLNLADQRLRIVDKAFISSILDEIYQSKIQLQHLHIKTQESSKYCNTSKLVSAMLGLKTLKTISLIRVPKLTLSDAIALCKQLEKLSELILLLLVKDKNHIPTVADYVTTAEMIAQRPENSQLVFKVNCKRPFGHIPGDVRRNYNDTFKIKRIDSCTIPYFHLL